MREQANKLTLVVTAPSPFETYLGISRTKMDEAQSFYEAYGDAGLHVVILADPSFNENYLRRIIRLTNISCAVALDSADLSGRGLTTSALRKATGLIQPTYSGDSYSLGEYYLIDQKAFVTGYASREQVRTALERMLKQAYR